MKIFVEYNAEGIIRSVALPTTVRVNDDLTIDLRLLPSPGHFITELEVEHIKVDGNQEKIDKSLEAWNDIKYKYQIQDHPHRPHLVQKSEDKDKTN